MSLAMKTKIFTAVIMSQICLINSCAVFYILIGLYMQSVVVTLVP